MFIRFFYLLIGVFCCWTCGTPSLESSNISRLVSKPDGINVSKEARSKGPLGPAFFWTGEEIAGWRREVGEGFVTLRSPELAIGELKDLGAIEIVVADFKGRNRLTFHWNDDPDLSAKNALQRRRELTTFPGFCNIFQIDGQNLVDIERQGLNAESSQFRYIFLRFNTDGGDDIAFTSIGILGNTSALATMGDRISRIGVRGQYRDAYLFQAPAKVYLAADLAKGGDLCFGLHAPDGKNPLKFSVSVNGTNATALYKGFFVQNGGWQDFRVNVPPRSGKRLVLSIDGDEGGTRVYLANPLFLTKKPARHPNIIIYLCDALRAEQMSLYGFEKKTTPFLDKLADTGLVFDRAFAPVSWTKPAVVTMMTSIYPQTHAVGERSLGDILPEAVPTMADILGARGYLTASFTANPMGSTLSNLDQGFDETFSPAAFAIENAEAKLGKIHSDDLNRAVLPWIEAHAQNPFFIYIHAIDTHVPYAAPVTPAHLSGQDKQDFYNAEIHFNDGQIETLYRGLAALGLAEDTIFIVTSDHGESFGEHGLFGHGTQVYQEEMWIPMVWIHPQGVKKGRTNRPFQLVDLLPTLLTYCDIPYDPHEFQGVNFFDETKPSAPVFLSRFLYPRDMEMERFNSIEYYGVVDLNWKLIVSADMSAVDPDLKLFDLQADPDEKVDLASSMPERTKSLYDLLIAFLADQQQEREKFIARYIVGDPMQKSREETMSAEVREQLRSLGYVK